MPSQTRSTVWIFSEKVDVEVIFNQTDMATARVMAGRSGKMKSEENMKQALSSNGKKLLQHNTEKAQ